MEDEKISLTEVKSEIGEAIRESAFTRSAIVQKAIKLFKKMVENDRNMPSDIKVKTLMMNGLSLFAGVGMTASGIKNKSAGDVKFGIGFGAIGALGLAYFLKFKIFSSTRDTNNQN